MKLEIVHIICAFLVIAGVGVMVLGVFRNFGRQIQKIKIARLGIEAELSTMGLWLVLGFLLVAAGIYLYLESGRSAKPAGPVSMRLNVHFEPDEVNPRHPNFNAKAFVKTTEGEKAVPLLREVHEGSLSVRVELPDMETPFFIIFETPKGIWMTDDHSIKEAPSTARKQGME